MKIPLYWGGMILDSIDTAYAYEDKLKRLLEGRFKRLSQNWELFISMAAVYERKKKAGAYKNTPLLPLPEDPLVHIEENACYWQFLRLPRKKINILKLECYKYARRNGIFPGP